MEPTKEIETLLTYLDQSFNSESVKLVGKILKRIELIEPENTLENKSELIRLKFLKKECRELIYESFREMRDIFFAYKYGLETTNFKLNKESKENGRQ